jgi:hypothetical protein
MDPMHCIAPFAMCSSLKQPPVGRVAAPQCFGLFELLALMCCTALLACNALNHSFQRSKPHVAERSLLHVSLLSFDVLQLDRHPVQGECHHLVKDPMHYVAHFHCAQYTLRRKSTSALCVAD